MPHDCRCQPVDSGQALAGWPQLGAEAPLGVGIDLVMQLPRNRRAVAGPQPIHPSYASTRLVAHVLVRLRSVRPWP